MDDETPKLDALLSHRPLGRVMKAAEDIGAEFAIIRHAFKLAGKGIPQASDFARVGRASGTHLIKLVTPRAPTGQSVIRIIQKGSNRHPELYPSIDAKKAPVAKLVFRPLEVSGHRTRSLADHILNPDELSPALTKAFADVFGKEAFEALQDALSRPLEAVTVLPVAEFPIIFLPRPGGGDLQATPLAPAEAYVGMGQVTEPYFRKREEGKPPVPRGRWQRQYVADKPQNISSAVGPRRTRFFARMPDVLDRWSAEIFRYTHGGRFPRWRDTAVVEAVEAYARLFDRSADYSNQDIRAALDRRADGLICAAQEFIDETMAEVELAGIAMARPPSVTTVLLDRNWPADGRDRARRVLTDDHFKSRLRKAGVA